jgi:hypothetical protein
MVCLLDLSSHKLPHKGLKANHLVGGLERCAEREVQPHVASVASGVTDTKNLWKRNKSLKCVIKKRARNLPGDQAKGCDQRRSGREASVRPSLGRH